MRERGRKRGKEREREQLTNRKKYDSYIVYKIRKENETKWSKINS